MSLDKDRQLERLRDKLTCAELNLKWSKIDLDLAKAENARMQKLLDGQSLDHLNIVIRQRSKFPPKNFLVQDPDSALKPILSFPPKGKFPEVFTPLNSSEHESKIPSLRKLGLQVSDGKFDCDDWWVVRTANSENISVTLVFYGGAFDYTDPEAYGIPVAIPFHKNATFRSSYGFKVNMVRGLGLRFSIYYV